MQVADTKRVRGSVLLAALAVLAAGGTMAGPAAAQTGVEVGVLNCRVMAGTGFVFGSSKELDCTFQSGDAREHYRGTVNKFGIDLGFTSASAISWAVFAPTAKIARGALGGTYAGVGGEATVGVGVGANALVGGNQKTISLQPLSVQAQQGLNVAVGIAAIELRPD